MGIRVMAACVVKATNFTAEQSITPGEGISMWMAGQSAMVRLTAFFQQPPSGPEWELSLCIPSLS